MNIQQEIKTDLNTLHTFLQNTTNLLDTAINKHKSSTDSIVNEDNHKQWFKPLTFDECTIEPFNVYYFIQNLIQHTAKMIYNDPYETVHFNMDAVYLANAWLKRISFQNVKFNTLFVNTDTQNIDNNTITELIQNLRKINGTSNAYNTLNQLLARLEKNVYMLKCNPTAIKDTPVMIDRVTKYASIHIDAYKNVASFLSTVYEDYQIYQNRTRMLQAFRAYYDQLEATINAIDAQSQHVMVSSPISDKLKERRQIAEFERELIKIEHQQYVSL